MNGERVRLIDFNTKSAGTCTKISLRREFRSTPRENDREVRKWIGEGPSSQQVEDETVDELMSAGQPVCLSADSAVPSSNPRRGAIRTRKVVRR